MGGEGAARNRLVSGRSIAGRVFALDLLLAITRLDEAALRFQRCDIGARELFRDLAKRRAARGEALNETLVDRLAFAVLLLPVRRWHVDVTLDQSGQVDRHQATRVLRRRIERL